MPDATPLVEAILRLLFAGAVAGLIGWNRERAGKPAGLRTFTLVGVGSCLFTLLGLEFIEAYKEAAPAGMDPLRVVSGLIGGIGFLGAGTIIQARGSVSGVTTAAGLWITAAIGLGAGMGQYALAGVGAGLAMVALLGMWLAERWIGTKSPEAPANEADPSGAGPGAPAG